MSDTPPTLLLTIRARRLAGRRRVRRAVVVLVAVVTLLVVIAQLQAAGAARRRWDEMRVVAVARRDLRPGEVVTAGAVERRTLPAVAVTDAALAEAPLGSVVRYPVVAGEPLVADRLAPEGLTGVAALVPAGERAVTLPVGPGARPPLQVGDRVDVLAVTFDDTPPVEPPHDDAPPAKEPEPEPEVEGSNSAGSATQVVVPLVERALVVDVADEAVTVAVPAALAPIVAHAVTQGAVVLTLTGE